jgi:beta-glucosidase
MTRRARALLISAGFLGAGSPGDAFAQGGATRVWLDTRLPVDERVQALLAEMTIEEKFWQLFMIPGDLDDPTHDWSNGVFGLQIGTGQADRWDEVERSGDTVSAVAGADAPDRLSRARRDAAATARAHAERINAIQRYFVEQTRLGIPIIPFDEAVHGLTRAGATVFPQAIALAATWDTALMGRVSRAIARETRSRGVRQVLSPVVNIASDVRWGRVEETYGEDPYLTSVMGRTFVRAFERAGIIATPKHFVANVGEGGRDSYPIEWSERLLEETHFPPFRSAIAAGARSVMTAYNSVDGSPATQSRLLLNDKLKRQWGFRGFVISDAAATGGATVLHMTESSTAAAAKHALESGLDVIFQSSWPQHRPYLDAFRRGLIADSVIDAAVGRVLRAKFELGLFERPYVDADSAAHWNGSPEHRALATEAARAAIVLLRNEQDVLPLRRDLTSIAVIGADAVEARPGGYSAPGVHTVSILDGMRTAAATTGTTIHFARGPGRLLRDRRVVPAESFTTTRDGQTVPGLTGEYFDNNRLEGEPRVIRTDARIDFGWTLNSPARGIPFDWYSVRWTGQVTIPAGPPRRIGVEGNDGYRLWLDDVLVIDNWRKQSFGTYFTRAPLQPGRTHALRLEYFESTGNARVKLVFEEPDADADAQSRIAAAVDAARRSDVAIIVAGIEEGEFRDRAFLGLPGLQEQLITDVAATGTPVVVVTIGGSAITMPWLDRVAAVLHAWYPGETGGTAVAEVLFGDADPAGRLPITFPLAEGQLPLVYNHKPTGRGDDYLDLTGQPLFPFGFGLSYTTFAYSGLRIEPAEIRAGESATVRLRVRNTGFRAADEVVQLYLRDVLATVARPVMQLAGFQRIHLASGETRDVVFEIAPDQLSMLDEDMRRIIEPGTFRVMVGRSSKDIQLRGELHVR